VTAWAATASYDLRNLLGLLLISAFIPLFALARAYARSWRLWSLRGWNVADGIVAAALAALCVAATSPLAKSDEKLRQRFATEQLSKSAGLEINRDIQKLLVRGCTIFNSDNYLHTIVAFDPFESRMLFFFSGEQLNDQLTAQVRNATGCAAFFYPPERTHPSILDFISSTARERNYAKLAEGRGMVLLGSASE
jgi:hypothetical protein